MDAHNWLGLHPAKDLQHAQRDCSLSLTQKQGVTQLVGNESAGKKQGHCWPTHQAASRFRWLQ